MLVTKALDKLIIDGDESSIIPPIYRYYNRKVGNDYNEVGGYVIQWPNGLQIITGAYSFGTTGFSTKWGDVFYKSNSQYLPHFDAEFKEPPIVLHNCNGGQGGGGGHKTAGTTAYMYHWNNLSTTRMGNGIFTKPVKPMFSQAIAMEFVAIGEWKTYEGGSVDMNVIEKITKKGTGSITNPDIDMYMCPLVTNYTLENGTDKVIKFQNGLMIITGTRNLGSKAITKAWGSVYETDSFQVGDFSVAFVDVPNVQMVPTKNSVDCILEVKNDMTATTIGKTWAMSPVSTTGVIEIAYQAIGMWK